MTPQFSETVITFVYTALNISLYFPCLFPSFSSILPQLSISLKMPDVNNPDVIFYTYNTRSVELDRKLAVESIMCVAPATFARI